MLRPALLVVLAFAVSGVQAQVETHGPAASVLSPTSPGVAHGTPASVNSPVPRNNGLFVGPRRTRVFGNPRPRHPRRDNSFIPVPIFIPAYPLTDYGTPDQAAATAADATDAANAADEQAAAPVDTEALRQAYYRGAHDALAQQRADSRYGEHYLDSREKNPPAPASKDRSQPKESRPQDDTAAAEDSTDGGPATVFIFKDGHRLETQNYAIQGQTLFDFSNNHLNKIKLADLDLDATRKANDNLGINVKFPPATP